MSNASVNRWGSFRGFVGSDGPLAQVATQECRPGFGLSGQSRPSGVQAPGGRIDVCGAGQVESGMVIRPGVDAGLLAGRQ